MGAWEVPPAEPFVSRARMDRGFRRDKAAARAWLSKRWAELSLPLPRTEEPEEVVAVTTPGNYSSAPV